MNQSALDQKIMDLVTNPNTKDMGFNLLVNNYQKSIYWRIRELIHTPEDAADVLQNVLIKVSKSVDSFKGNSKLYSWLYRIATNESLSYIDAQKRRFTAYGSHNIGLEKLDQNTGSAGVDAQRVEQLLHAAMDTLPDKQREVFRLRYYEELDYKSMSKLTLTSIGALKASYHHAVKKIENYIKSNHEG